MMNVVKKKAKNFFVKMRSGYLYDDYLVFVGNYKDSTKTITFAEPEETGLGSDAFASGVPKNQIPVRVSGFFIRLGTRKGGTSAHTGVKIESRRAIFSPWESP